MRICTQVNCEYYNSDGVHCVEVGCFGVLADGKSTVADMKETHTYLRGIVGIDGWVDLAIALKTYADNRPTKSVDDNDMDAAYLMLMGYALENLAKSIISCRAYDAKLVDVSAFKEKLNKFAFLLNDCKTKCSLKTHELEKLYKANDLGFRVSVTEIEHLAVISRYTLWKGRYPVPLDIKDVPSSEPNFNDLSNTARDIYNRAMAEVQRLRSSRT
jgi:hypothetical protein